jgi:2-keto-4-pentenoate hydratase/2-oxohepta-3-ene-1,7-dioic acid hydratase in catechol pathway
VRYAHLATQARPLAAIVGNKVVPLADELGTIASLDELVGAGPNAWRDAEAAAARLAGDGYAIEEVELAAPLAAPSKILCVGLNYRDHATEANLDLPAAPLIFAKLRSTLIGHGQAIVHPSDQSEKVDWEAELAVVVGRRLRHADAATAMDAVFGYTAANDVSARDVQFADGQWMRGKSFDTFCPVGPWVVTADEYGDPSARRLSATVNGETMQDSSTSQMVFGVAEILSYISTFATLEPGDLVLTGTPAGVGGFRQPPVFLRPGDRVDVYVEGVGVLSNPVVEAPHTGHRVLAATEEGASWTR